MKRCFISAIFICLLTCCSCGNTEPLSPIEETTSIDPVSEKISKDIDSIGEVSLEDKELIETIEKTYATLTEKQKDGVSNYATLLVARDELNALIKEQEEKEQETTEPKKEYSDSTKLCARALLTLDEVLKNPESLQVIELYHDVVDGYDYIY